MILSLLIFLFLVQINHGEQPLSICSTSRPYKTKHLTCANFTDVCLKTDDLDCENFQSVCQQCPASKLTLSTYENLLKLTSQVTNVTANYKGLPDYLTKKIENIHNKIGNIEWNFQELNNKTKTLASLMIVGVVLICIVPLSLFLEMRFKLLTKCFSYLRSAKKEKYQLLESRKSRRENDISIQIHRKISELENNFDNKLKQIISSIETKNKTKYITTFEIKGFKDPVEMIVSDKDSIIHVKRQICDKLPNAQPHWYKVMKLKHDDCILDDNEFLRCCLSRRDCIIKCEMDHSVNHEQIVVVKLKSNMETVDLIQIQLDQTISRLKEMVHKETDSKDILIVKDNLRLSDERTMRECQIKDDDCLFIVLKESGKLIMKSVFEENESLVIEYCNFDTVQALVKKVANKFHTDENNFFLLMNGKCLDEEKFIYEYNINNESKIIYYFVLRAKDVKLAESPMDEGYITELFEGKHISTNTKIFILRSNINVVELETSKEDIKKLIEEEIRDFHQTKLQLKGVYKDAKSFYVAFEYMSGGTLTKYIRDNRNIPDNQISLWTRQILEYLKFNHDREKIYQDMKLCDIFIDSKGNAKMHSLVLNKYFYEKDLQGKLDKIFRRKTIPQTYLAPEIRKKESFDKSVDVWSLGVVLIHIVTDECPKEKKLGILEYKFPEERSKNLKQFIDLCINADPKKRASIGNLLEHDFLK